MVRPHHGGGRCLRIVVDIDTAVRLHVCRVARVRRSGRGARRRRKLGRDRIPPG